ncbi:MAG: NAD(P)H-hydrate epimerase [Candidatus Dormibacteria bacterium]
MSLSPAASAEQARMIDGAAAQLGVSTDALMALASFQCARLARILLQERSPEGSVAVLAGRGNNGGDALGCARHLAAWGHPVRALTLGGAGEPDATPARQARAAEACGAEVRQGGSAVEQDLVWALERAELIVDGLLGTGSTGPPRNRVGEAVRGINGAGVEVLAIDLPSGLDATTGETAGDCVRATATLMLAVAKLGCLESSAGAVVGQLWLADIGVPTAAYRAAGVAPPQFAGASLVPFPSSS